MQFSLSLDPQRIQNWPDQQDPSTPEGSLLHGFMTRFQSIVASCLSADYLSARDIPELLQSIYTVRMEFYLALREAISGLSGEARRKTGSTPLLRLITREDCPPNFRGLKLDLIERPDVFLYALSQRMTECDDDFGILQQIHANVLTSTTIPRLLGKVCDGARAKNRMRSLPKVFEAVQHALAFDSKCRLPADEAANLYFLTYLPSFIRYAAQDTIVNRTLTGCFRQLLPEKPEHNEVQFWDAIKWYYQHNIFCGKRWTELLQWYGPDKRVNRAAEDHLRMSQEELQKLAILLPQGRNFSMATAHLRQLAELNMEIEKLDERSGCKRWQAIDVAHCFEGFYDADLHPVLRGERSFSPSASSRIAKP